MIVSLAPVRELLTLTAIVAAALLTASCADTRGGSIPYDRPLALPDAPKVQTLDANYKIAPLDKLTIKVFKSDELSGDYDVDPSRFAHS